MPQASPAKNWCVTWNNYPEDWEEKLVGVDVLKYWVMGKEVAETGTPHLQGYIQLVKKMRATPLLAVLTAAGIQVHLTKAKGTLSQNQTYCKKDGDWKEHGVPTGKGKRSDILALRDSIVAGKTDLQLAMDDNTCKASAQFARFTQNLRNQLRAKTADEALSEMFDRSGLQTWQQDCVDKLDAQCDRKITWYWDEDGNTGKSWLTDWLAIKRGAFIVTGGKFCDIAYAFNYQEVVVFDYARDQEDRFPYKLLEDFKNLRVFSSKYESIMKRAVSCHLIVFANFGPDRSKLSRDRWDVNKLNLQPLVTGPPRPALIIIP